MTAMQQVRSLAEDSGGPSQLTAKYVSEILDLKYETAKSCLKRLRKERKIIGSDDLTLKEVLHRKRLDYQRKKADHDHTLVVNLPTMDPIGLCFIGDPHIDDDGCDIETLEEHLNIMKDTDGLLGFSVGDYTNNWPGRLGQLYSEQHTTSKEILLLIEWFVRAVPWLALIGGNHDVWDRRSDLMYWLSKQAGIKFKNHSMRIILKFPNKREVRISARHDFKGSSIWNKGHGVMRAGQKGLKDHVIVGGHRHVSAFAVQVDSHSGLIQHCQLVAGYKTVDDYQQANDLEKHFISPSHCTIIDPNQKEDTPRLLQTFLDLEQGADYLKFLRKH
jgi:hypothetical protein